MKLFISTLGLLLWFCGYAWAQRTFSGQVIDATTNLAIPYVNVGVLHSGCGSVSNESGFYSFQVSGELRASDTLRLSSIGYATLDVPVSACKENWIAKLNPVSYSIAEVLVKPKKRMRLGSDTQTKNMNASVSGTADLGHEFGSRIKIRHKICLVNSFGFNIIDNAFDSIQFRLNLYDMEHDVPGKNLLTKGIIFKVTQKDGYFKLDLSPYAIYLQHDVLLSLELIAYNGSPGSYINLSCALGGPSFYRKTSHDEWTHVPMIRIGAFLDVDYEKQ